MDGNFLSAGQPDVGQEALIPSDERAMFQGGGEVHKSLWSFAVSGAINKALLVHGQPHEAGFDCLQEFFMIAGLASG